MGHMTCVPAKQTDPQYKLRYPAELRDRIAEAAKANNRSVNAEIVARLERTFRAEGKSIGRPSPSPHGAADDLRQIANALVDAAALARESGVHVEVHLRTEITKLPARKLREGPESGEE